MRTGRLVKEEALYKIIIHTNGGRRYASTKVAVRLKARSSMPQVLGAV